MFDDPVVKTEQKQDKHLVVVVKKKLYTGSGAEKNLVYFESSGFF